MSTNDKTGMFLNFTLQELAQGTAHNLEPFIKETIERLLAIREEDLEKPLSFQEACDWLGISRSTLSDLIKGGHIRYSSLNPNHSKAKKLFTKKDLRDWMLENKVRTVQELKAGGYGQGKS